MNAVLALGSDPMLAAAAGAAPDLSGLGPFAILQFFGGLTIVAISLLAWFRGMKDKTALPPVLPIPTQEPLQMFFDGPLVTAIELLRGIDRTLKLIEEGQHEAAANLERINRETSFYRETAAKNAETLSAILRKMDDRKL